jgi:hypothetical protein
VVAKDSKITKAEDQMMEKLNELTNQFSEMKVNMARNLNKQPKPTNTRTNVWCTNCQGQGHCSVNFLFFELDCEILCERNLLFIAFRKLEVVRY